MVSALFDPDAWEPIDLDLDDLTYHRGTDVSAVRIAFDRPDVRNAFRPETVDELLVALNHAKRQSDVGTVLLTGNGPADDGGWAFSAGGDQSVRSDAGYGYDVEDGEQPIMPLGMNTSRVTWRFTPEEAGPHTVG